MGAGSSSLETIRKVGYRLLVAGDHAAVPLLPPAPEQGAADSPASAGTANQSQWRHAIIASAALVLATGGMIGLNGTPDRPTDTRQPVVATINAKTLEPAARDLAMRGAAASFEQTATQQAQAVLYFRAAIDKAPENSALWGSLAMNYLLSVPYARVEDHPVLMVRARQAAQRSLALNPRKGHALAATTYGQPIFGNWTAKEAVYRRAVAQSDGVSAAPIIHYAHFLASVGRTRDALEQARRAMVTHPLVPWLNANWIEMLAVNGRLDEAERAAERAAMLWPRNYDRWIAQFLLRAFHGSTSDAIAMADDRKRWPEGMRPGDVAVLRQAAQAIASRSPGDADRVIDAYTRLADEGQAYVEQAIRVAARLDRPDAALRFANDLYARDRVPAVTKRFVDRAEYGWRGERATAPLFLVPSNRLWNDDRFLALTASTGLVAYWRQAGPPDLCRTAKAACERYGLGGG